MTFLRMRQSCEPHDTGRMAAPVRIADCSITFNGRRGVWSYTRPPRDEIRAYTRRRLRDGLVRVFFRGVRGGIPITFIADMGANAAAMIPANRPLVMEIRP